MTLTQRVMPLAIPCLLATSGFAQISPRDFDRDQNGRLEGQEAADYIWHVNEEMSRTTAQDVTAFEACRTSQEMTDAQLDLHLERMLVPKVRSLSPVVFPHGWFVRRTQEDWIKPYEMARPALFSFKRDFESDNTILSAVGSVIYVRDFGSTTDVHKFILGSISFDRVVDGDGKSDVDDLTARFGGDLGFYDLQGNGNRFTFDLRYDTDFDFASDVIGAQASWSPKVPRLGIGQPKAFCGNRLRYAIEPQVNLELGTVLDDGGNSTLEDEESFFRIGPSVKLSIVGPEKKPGQQRAHWWERLEFILLAGVKWGIVGEPELATYLDADLRYALDQEGHFAIGLNYRNGETPFLAQRTHTFTIGLGVKF